MSTSTTASKNLGIVKMAGVLTLIAGIVFVLAGGATWAMVSSQLKDQNITVSDDARWFAGQQVAGPFTAYSEADVINTHALAATTASTDRPLTPGAAGAVLD